MTTPPHIARLELDVPDAPDSGVKLAPRNPGDVASILRHATENRLVVQVWGGGTRSGFGEPPPPDIVMTMTRLAQVEAWEPEDLTLVVGAGAKATDIEEMLEERNQTAVLPEVSGDSTIGGVISAGASGFKRGRLYGTRERVLEVTLVTGDGRIVRGGGRVVKNVTGYDLPRLVVGAFGSLGVVVSVCLKLWPAPPHRATITIDSPQTATRLTRPLAVLQDAESTKVFLWGTPEEIEAQAMRLGGERREGHMWPSDPAGRYQWSLRIPPAATSDAVSRLPGSWSFVALHGVGEIRAASDDAEGAGEIRAWAESLGGRLVSVRAPDSKFDPWGAPPPALEMQRRVISQFDPGRVINPGRLPGGL